MPFSTLNCWLSEPAYQRRSSERERKVEQRMRRRVVYPPVVVRRVYVALVFAVG